MAVAGDIVEITFNHPVYGSGTFKPVSGEDGTFDLGGRRALDDDAITSDSEKIKKIQMMPWKFEGTIRWAAQTGLDVEKMNSLSGDPIESDWTFELMDGTIYGGVGSPVGDVVGSAKDGTISIKVIGGGGLRQL